MYNLPHSLRFSVRETNFIDALDEFTNDMNTHFYRFIGQPMTKNVEMEIYNYLNEKFQNLFTSLGFEEELRQLRYFVEREEDNITIRASNLFTVLLFDKMFNR